MSGHPFDFCGERLVALPSGALHWPARRVAVVADLHLGKGRALAERGAALLPPYDDAETLERLAAALAGIEAETVISLGDGFDAAETPIDAECRVALATLARDREWIWVLGNHDPSLPEDLEGRTVESLRLGPLTFRHEARTEAEPGEISGHYHPKASIRLRGRRIAGRCFAHDARRLILPAFGAYTGGLDVADPAIAALMAAEFTVLLRHGETMHAIPSRRVDV